MSDRDRERWAAIALGAWFVGRMLWFALQIAPNVPPDEDTHVGLAVLHARTFLLPEDGPATWRFGPIAGAPYLYHWLAGKLLLLNVFGMEPHAWLRLWNVALGAGTAALGWSAARRLIEGSVGRLLFLVLLTNTLMFTFLSSAVSYDNLANFLAAAAVLCMVRHLQGGDARWVLGGIVALGLGGLTKISFLPVPLVIGAAWLGGRWGHWAGDARALWATLRPPAARSVALWVGVAIVSLANLALYGGNLARHGTPTPDCRQVLTLEQCQQWRIFARNWVVEQYREDAMTFEQAYQAAGAIRHPSDRDYARVLLLEDRRFRSSSEGLLTRYEYLHLVWDRAVKPTVFGIQAHHSLLPTGNQLLGYHLVLLATFLLIARGLRIDGRDRVWWALAFVVMAYFVFLVGVFGYGSYRKSHLLMAGVQGRYLFHVLVPAYLLMAEFLLRPFGRRARLVVAAVVAAWFVAGDYPFFARHDSAGWYVSPRIGGAPR